MRRRRVSLRDDLQRECCGDRQNRGIKKRPLRSFNRSECNAFVREHRGETPDAGHPKLNQRKSNRLRIAREDADDDDVHRPEHRAEKHPRVARVHRKIRLKSEEDKPDRRERDAEPHRASDALSMKRDREKRHEDDIQTRDERAIRRGR